MYLYVDCLEREINVPRVCTNADELRKVAVIRENEGR